MVGSPQAALRDALATVRARIDDLHEHGDRISEQDTKAILVDPVLAALGWRLHELEDVRREYRAKPQDNPVDYALLVFGKPRLFVEAKAFSTPLDRKCAAQVLGYASVVGVGWCLLTNGDEYRLYNSHAKVDVDEKLLRSVRLSDSAQVELCVETLGLMAREEMGDIELDLLWKSQFVDRRVKETLEALFADDSGPLARLVRKHSTELSFADVRESLRRAQIHVQFPVATASASSSMVLSSSALSIPVELPPLDGDSKPSKSPAAYSVAIQDLIAADLVHPPMLLEKTYKGVELQATIEVDGCVSVDGERYDSLSTAAGMARKSVIGAPPDREFPSTNGWTFWCHRDDAGKLQPIDGLRQTFLSGREA